MAAKYGFLAGAALVVLVGACAPKSEPVAPIYTDPIYQGKYGDTATCPPGTVRETHLQDPRRIQCRIPPDECDDPFWETYTHVQRPDYCLPRIPGDEQENGDDEQREQNNRIG